MDKLTAEELRSVSKVDYEEKGFPAPSGADPDPLDLEIDRAVAWLEWATGRTTAEFTDGENEAIMWDQATQLLTEMRINHRTEDYTDAIHSDAQELSVTGYSEKRISYKERRPFRQITYHNELDELLWMLMTEAKTSYWISTFTRAQVPVEVISPFNSSLDRDDYYT